MRVMARMGRRAFLGGALLATLGALGPACKGCRQTETTQALTQPAGALVNPSDFPRVKVTPAGASFKVDPSKALKINTSSVGAEAVPDCMGTHGVYRVADQKHVGYIRMAFHSTMVLLFNLAGEAVVGFEPKSYGEHGLWLPADKPLIYRDGEGIEVKAKALPWIPKMDAFGGCIEGDGLDSRLVRITN